MMFCSLTACTYIFSIGQGSIYNNMLQEFHQDWEELNPPPPPPTNLPVRN